ncbi:MAG: MarR family transcriptional regulator [bacterium]
MPNELLKTAEDLVTLLPRITRQIARTGEGDPASELPVAQLRVCAILREGSHPMTALANELGITLSALTQLVDRLEHAGLVARTADETDRRVKLLQLTPQAVKMFARRKDARIQRAAYALATLDDTKREQVLETLHLLLNALQNTTSDTNPIIIPTNEESA